MVASLTDSPSDGDYDNFSVAIVFSYAFLRCFWLPRLQAVMRMAISSASELRF
jgi:hypothetical protein